MVVDHPCDTSLPAEKLRDVIEATDKEPVLSEELLETLRWCANYYHHPIGEVLNQALPYCCVGGAVRSARRPDRGS